MKKSLAVVLLVLVSSAVFAMPQVSRGAVAVNIPFQFFAGEKSLPPGTYRFVVSGNLGSFTLTSEDGKANVISPVLTRLSQRSTDEASAVFDVVGNDHYLSEFYLPGMDGFCFKGAATNHTHLTVKGKQ